MTFQEICEQTQLPPEAVRFYVESKLIAPLYPKRNTPDEGEYSQEDVIRLLAIQNLRRLDVSIDDIRIILLDPSRAQQIVEDTKARMQQLITITNNRLEQFDLLDLAVPYAPETLLLYLSQFHFSTPLPRRDIDQDEGHKIRNDIAEREHEIQDLFNRVNQLDHKRKKQRRALIWMTILLLIMIGWIIAPIWMAYLTL